MSVKPIKNPRCPQCGFHIRGKEHEDGIHHKVGKSGKATIKK